MLRLTNFIVFVEINTHSELMPNNTLQKKLEQGHEQTGNVVECSKNTWNIPRGRRWIDLYSWLRIKELLKRLKSFTANNGPRFRALWKTAHSNSPTVCEQHSSMCTCKEFKDFNTQYHQKKRENPLTAQGRKPTLKPVTFDTSDGTALKTSIIQWWILQCGLQMEVKTLPCKASATSLGPKLIWDGLIYSD